MTQALFDLTGKVALVTGTSRGLGQYFARALANAGADLILTSRRKENLLPFAAEIEKLGRRAAPLTLDVRDQRSIEAMAEAAEASFGHVDILVNNAGCNVRKPAFDVTWEDWNLILDTNLRGSFFVAQQIAKRMAPRGYGRIVNIGSVTSVFGYTGLAPYGASRGGIRQLTMSLADDWGKYGVTVNWWIASRSSGPGLRMIWTALSCFWRPNRVDTLRGRRCWSTAVSPRVRCAQRLRPQL